MVDLNLDQLFEGIPPAHTKAFRDAVQHLTTIQLKVCRDRIAADEAWQAGQKDEATKMHGDAHFKQKAINVVLAMIETL